MKRVKKTVLLLLSGFLIAGSVYFLWSYFKRTAEEQQIKDEAKAVADIVDSLGEPGEEILKSKADNKQQKPDDKELANELLDTLNKKYETDNIIALIDTGKGGIREVVGYREDSDYFDRRNIQGEYDYNGTVFLYKENKSPNDPYTNYFAHNVQSGERFFKLSRYEDYKDYLQTATVYTREGILNYQLVQVMVMDSMLFDQYTTWEQNGMKSYFQNVAFIGHLLFQKEDFLPNRKYMQLITCRDHMGKEKIIATYILNER